MSSKIKKKVIVRQYRCLEPVNWADDAHEHLFLQNKMWNELVALERGNFDEYKKIMSTDPVVAQIEQQIEKTNLSVEESITERNKIRVKIRKKKGPETKVVDQKIAQSKKDLKDLRSKAREARKKAKEKTKPLLSDLDKERKEAVKKIYKNSGLWWGNYNGVVDSYNKARSKAMKEGAQLNFHRFTGEGRFRVQIQGGMTVEELQSGSKAILSLAPKSNDEFNQILGKNPPIKPKPNSKRSRKQKALLKFTLYTYKDDKGKSQRRTLDFPVIVHRTLPEGENILLKEAILRKDNLGPGKFRWHVTFTFVESDPEGLKHKLKDKACGINLGWKQVKEGLRIATIYNGEEYKHFVMPQKILDNFQYIEELQSQIDTMTNDNFTWIKNIIVDPTENIKEAFTKLKRAKRPHPQKFAKLVFALKSCDSLPISTEAYLEAEKRRKLSKRVELEMKNLKDKTLAHRLDLYRNWGKEVAENYSTIILDKMDISHLSKLEKSDGSSSELHEKARRNRVYASVYSFREWIVKQSAKAGGIVEVVKSKTSSFHADCGGKLEKKCEIFWTCPKCGKLFDQDENTAKNLFLRTTSC